VGGCKGKGKGGRGAPPKRGACADIPAEKALELMAARATAYAAEVIAQCAGSWMDLKWLGGDVLAEAAAIWPELEVSATRWASNYAARRRDDARRHKAAVGPGETSS